MMNLMLIMSMILTFTFLFLNHPLSFGLVLLMQTILVALISGTITLNFWYSYILFLIMVGGMLVLFIYMTSIASNEKFKFSPKLFLLIKFLTPITLLIMFINNFLTTIYLNNINFNNLNFSFSMNKYMNWPTNMMYFIIVIYLFITLIAVVKITNINYGPLRQKF
uniref:NADH-ubiquinone oxidoreductase chain 6 n=1 Tax=Cucujus mniszechi TaxID=433034 RepID=A0A7G7MUF8_9CUCU|nr:NADH dehydrogenase subunit 6 [Cucujus mniszechi]QNG56467.1 NADH dehydrogenase subunit 6 [Cucujus mniszechi]